MLHTHNIACFVVAILAPAFVACGHDSAPDNTLQNSSKMTATKSPMGGAGSTNQAGTSATAGSTSSTPRMTTAGSDSGAPHTSTVDSGRGQNAAGNSSTAVDSGVASADAASAGGAATHNSNDTCSWRDTAPVTVKSRTTSSLITFACKADTASRSVASSPEASTTSTSTTTCRKLGAGLRSICCASRRLPVAVR